MGNGEALAKCKDGWVAERREKWQQNELEKSAGRRWRGFARWKIFCGHPCIQSMSNVNRKAFRWQHVSNAVEMHYIVWNKNFRWPKSKQNRYTDVTPSYQSTWHSPPSTSSSASTHWTQDSIFYLYSDNTGLPQAASTHQPSMSVFQGCLKAFLFRCSFPWLVTPTFVVPAQWLSSFSDI